MKLNKYVIGVLLSVCFATACAHTGTGAGQPNPDLGVQYLASAQDLENQDDLLAAMDQYKLALSADPGNQAAAEGQQRLSEQLSKLADQHYKDGMKYFQQGKFALALNAFSTALKYQPGHPGALEMTELWKQEKTGNYALHVVEPGESLSEIAKQYYGYASKFYIIALFNDIDDVTKVVTGQQIKVPRVNGLLFRPPTVQSPSPPVAAPKSATTQPDSTPPEPAQSPADDDRLSSTRQSGIELFNKAKYNDAALELSKAVAESPGDTTSRRYLAKAYFQLAMEAYNKGRFREAKTGFENAFNADGDCKKCAEYITRSANSFLRIHYNKGLIFFGRDQLSEAVTEWRLVYDMDPAYKDTAQNLRKAEILLENLERSNTPEKKIGRSTP